MFMLGVLCSIFVSVVVFCCFISGCLNICSVCGVFISGWVYFGEVDCLVL